MTQPTDSHSNGAGKQLSRIAIINRGEPAMRFLRAIREYNFERGCQIAAIAFATEPDSHASFVHMADEVVSIGGPFRTLADGSSVSAYCDFDWILEKLHEAECDAVWPGWGFVSEDPLFVKRLEEAGITFLGPSSDAMIQLGDKIASKELAEDCGVPLAPWSLISPDMSDETILESAEKIGFPLMVKASAGGGGRGIRKVNEAAKLLDAIREARDEVRKVFGQGGLFLEACIMEARHIEVQFVVGHDGIAEAVGIRDCSIQRRNQKVIEEGPSPVLTKQTEALLAASTKRLAEKAGYRGVGTAEFLYQPDVDGAYFLEVNSRLQVEHTVTESITGVDLVKAQIDIAQELPWTDDERPRTEEGVWESNGHAIEVRLCAEDPEQGFRPSPGFVKVFRAPFGPGIRVDNGVMEGMSIAPQFDSMIAKVIAWAPTRKQAIARLTRALRELEVVVEDGTTNKAFLLELLEHDEFVSGAATTGWLDGAVERGELNNPSWSFEALVVAAILEYRRRWQGDVQRFFSQVQNGIPQDIPQPDGRQLHLRLRGSAFALMVYALGNGVYRVGTTGLLHDVSIEFLTDHSAVMHTLGKRHQVLFSYGRTGMTIEIDGSLHAIERASGGRVKAPSPAMVVHVAAEEGDIVNVGDLLCTLEAMKMEMPVFAQEAGVVSSVLCQPNQQVHAGQALLIVEPSESGDEGEQKPSQELPEATPRLLDGLFEADFLHPMRLEPLPDDLATQVLREFLSAVQSIFLGFDLTPVALRRIDYLFGQDVDLLALKATSERWGKLAVALEEALCTFADLEMLFARDLQVHGRHLAEVSPELMFYDFCRRYQEGEEAVSEVYKSMLLRGLRWYGVHSLAPSDKLREALWRMSVAHAHGSARHRLCSALLRLLMGLHTVGAPVAEIKSIRDTLARVTQLANPLFPFVVDNARQASYVLFEQSRYVQRQQVVEKKLQDTISLVQSGEEHVGRASLVEQLVCSMHSLQHLLIRALHPDQPETDVLSEAIFRRMYPTYKHQLVGSDRHGETSLFVLAGQEDETSTSAPVQLPPEGFTASQSALASYEAPPSILGVVTTAEGLSDALARLATLFAGDASPEMLASVEKAGGPAAPWVAEVVLSGEQCASGLTDQLDQALADVSLPHGTLARLTISWCNGREKPRHRTYQHGESGFEEIPLLRDIHPEAAARIELWRLRNFSLERLEAPEQIFAFRATARENSKDERIFVFAEIRNMPEQLSDKKHMDQLWEFEQAFYEGLRVIRDEQSRRHRRRRFHWNCFTLFFRSLLHLGVSEIGVLAQRFEPHVRGLGLRKVVLRATVMDEEAPGGTRDVEVVIAKPGRHRLEVREQAPEPRLVRAMQNYDMKVVRARQLGTFYPYEVVRLLEGHVGDRKAPPTPLTGLQEPEGPMPTRTTALHPDIIAGHFVEYDLDEASGELEPVSRPYGENTSGVVVGIMTHETVKFPEGMSRVWIAADPTRSMGSLAEAECKRILGALELAEDKGIPIEWIPISAGARIAMDSGTENLDWTARVLRKIIDFTQKGGVINLIICGVNVGAQSYWNAEATMLMHTKGALIMTPHASMVLTGKKALEVSGSVSAEDERGIGGYERIMGPNGQAQYFAGHLGEAYHILFEYYRFTYKHACDDGPQRWNTQDPIDRSILEAPYRGSGQEDFQTIGDIFDEQRNPGRKKPFAIREVMAAVIDEDGGRLERYKSMRHADTSVVWDVHLGGIPTCLIGFESRPQERRGRIPMDGPDTWTGGTLYPQSSKKVARAINAASGNRPVVVLANLSGFDGSPESLRKLQLEMGAEIGRSIVNFEGPIVFVVIGRYHGGAYVVFSKALNPSLTTLALEGTFASVIGGGPAAAVVFPHKARQRTERDPRLVEARAAIETASEDEKPHLREKLDPLYGQILLEKQGEIAREFDAVHTVERAVSVGSIDAIVSPASLRPAVISILQEKLS